MPSSRKCLKIKTLSEGATKDTSDNHYYVNLSEKDDARWGLRYRN